LRYQINISRFVTASGQNTLPMPMPMLMVRGELSPYVEDGDSPLFQKYFPNAQLKTVIGADHWVHARDAEAFLGHLLGREL
jgi:esterase